MKRFYVIVILLMIWCFVAVGCAIFKVPFDIYGKYWWLVSILLLVLEYIELIRLVRNKKN